MSAVAATLPQSAGLAPFVFEDVAAFPDWRERLHWPIAQPEIVAVGAQVPAAVLEFAGSLTDPAERQVAVVAAGLFANGFMSLLEAAWVSDRAERLGLAVSGGPPEMALLARGESAFKVMEYRGPFNVRPAPRAFLRGIARTASWTPGLRLPLALAAHSAYHCC